MSDHLTEKRQIILSARKAVQQGLSLADNPYPQDSEAYHLWREFYEMTYVDGQRQSLFSHEYEASAY